jgi:hypothetical protein
MIDDFTDRLPETTLRAYTSASPLLLVTAFSPAHQGGGAVIVRSHIGERGANDIVWASLAARAGTVSGRVAHRQARRSAWLSPPRHMAQSIDALADRHDAAAIWIVAHGPVLPAVAPLVHRHGRRVHVSVHDDPAWAVVARTRRELPLTPWVHKCLGDALTAATSVDVISSGMQAELGRRYGVDSVVVHRVLRDEVKPNVVYDPRSSELCIGVLGSLYARRQLDLLLRVVATAARNAGVRGRVVVIGGQDPEVIRRAGRVRGVDATFTGHLGESEAIELLRGAFALYLSYPAGIRARVLRRTSFPTKLVTYLEAARPLLMHTPRDSTLMDLDGAAPYVIPWLDGDIDRGARELLHAWRGAEAHLSQHEPAERLRTRYFGPDNQDRLFDALDRLARG